jgi:hypothetical protein
MNTLTAPSAHPMEELLQRGAMKMSSFLAAQTRPFHRVGTRFDDATSIAISADVHGCA